MRRSYVEDDEGREPKRTRTSRACDQCRSKKYRCDGNQPKCSSCAKTNRECTYNPSRKRGLPTGYVKLLEMLLGLLLRASENNERILIPILQHCSRQPVSYSKEGDGSSDSVLEIWRKSEVLKHVEILTSWIQSCDEEDLAVPSIDKTLAAALSVYRNRNAAAEALVQFSNLEDHQLADKPGFATATASQVISPPNPGGLADSFKMTAPYEPSQSPLRLPSNWLELLEDFVATTHCWFPISQKHNLLRIAYTVSNTTAESHDGLVAGDLAFLWAVFAYAARHSKHSATQSYAPDQVESNNRGEVDFERVSFHFIRSGSLDYSLGHVQALLLLTLLSITKESWTPAWVQMGQTLYLASDLGIIPQQRNNDGHRSSMNLDDSQKRVFLGCFVLDTLISNHLKRRSFLNWSDLQSVGPMNIEGLEEWETWKPQSMPGIRPFPGKVLSTFNSFAQLLGLLNDVNNAPEGGLSANQTDMIRQRMALLEEKSLTQVPQNENGDDEFSHQPPHFLNLRFAFAGIRLAINRKLSVAQSGSHPDTNFLALSLRLFKKQSQTVSSPWHSPLLRIYLTIFNDELSIGRILRNRNDLVEWQTIYDHLISESHSTWQIPSKTAPEINDYPPPSPPSFTMTNQGGLFPPSHQFATSSPTSNLSSALFTAFTPSATVVDLTDTPLDPDEDALFDSLAMLDSVICPMDGPTFLEHLGMAPTENPIEFSDLFGS